MLTLCSVQNAFNLGRLAGFPIRLRLSFLLLLGLIWLTGGSLLFVLLTFASILVHELGHALVARRLGVRIAAIDLHMLGGAALMIDSPRNADHEIAIAAAGPAVSLGLAGLGMGLGALTGWSIVSWLGYINLALAIFNLLPALPMDGGRILRALLARRWSYGRATEAAVKVSRVFVVLFAVAALWLGQVQLLLLAGLLWMMGSAERRMAWSTGYRDTPVVIPREQAHFYVYRF
jgi:Zn-dependent protease